MAINSNLIKTMDTYKEDISGFYIFVNIHEIIFY